VNLLAMCPSVQLFLTPLLAAHRCERRSFVPPALLPQILAFWALWHCRHARPPDALSTGH